jgi:ADP-ribose pyrophosphatase
VLLVRRRNPPNRGRWALPGGLVELGETVQAAAVREILEETGLKVKIEGLLDVQTDLHADRNSRLEYHYVLVDYLASPVGGRLRLNPESSESGWFTRAQTGKLTMSRGTRAVLEMFFERHRP